MTSEIKVKPTQTFEILLPNREWETLAFLMLEKRKYISEAMTQTFGVTFERYGSTNPSSNPVGKITFTGEPGCEEKVQKFMEIMMEDFRARKYFSPSMTAEIAQQIEDNGVFDITKTKKAGGKSSNDFNKSAGNDNTSLSDYRTEGQKEFAAIIDTHDIIIGAGVAGTGKTHVAVIKGALALKSGAVKKLVITRVAVEAGEKIGFLPGKQEEKLAPYLIPIFDIFEKFYGKGYKKMIENGQIEIAPIGFLRGRTLENAFIVIDEAQNLTVSQTKMAMTRVGPGSKMVLTGDPDQVDIFEPSGMPHYMNVFTQFPRQTIGLHKFDPKDVMRSAAVKDFLEAEEAFNKKHPQFANAALPGRKIANAAAPENSSPFAKLSEEDLQNLALQVLEIHQKNQGSTHKKPKAALLGRKPQ